MHILVIGMGAGNPEHITIQAINALQRTDVLFLTDKGASKSELAQLRTGICERYLPGRQFRTVAIADPERDRSPADYLGEVEAWHDRRAQLYESLFAAELSAGGTGAFLVWGDPSLYDSTIRILETIRARGVVHVEFEVIPGITSIQALTASHRIPLNDIGSSVQITTGRQLASQPRLTSSDTVVLLDGQTAFTHVDDEDVEIFWGAYLGMAGEILLSGNLRDTAPRIQQMRAEARLRKGWIMDTYLLRKRRIPNGRKA